MEGQEADVDLELEPRYEVERILKQEKVKTGRKSSLEFLVAWRGQALDEAQWIPDANFTYPTLLKQQLKEDRPKEEK